MIVTDVCVKGEPHFTSLSSLSSRECSNNAVFSPSLLVIVQVRKSVIIITITSRRATAPATAVNIVLIRLQDVIDIMDTTDTNNVP